MREAGWTAEAGRHGRGCAAAEEPNEPLELVAMTADERRRLVDRARHPAAHFKPAVARRGDVREGIAELLRLAEVAARLLVDGRQRLSSNVAANVVHGGFEAV